MVNYGSLVSSRHEVWRSNLTFGQPSVGHGQITWDTPEI